MLGQLAGLSRVGGRLGGQTTGPLAEKMGLFLAQPCLSPGKRIETQRNWRVEFLCPRDVKSAHFSLLRPLVELRCNTLWDRTSSPQASPGALPHVSALILLESGILVPGIPPLNRIPG